MYFRQTHLAPHVRFTTLLFSASTIFALSGMFNVILFFATRPGLIVSPTSAIESEQVSLQHRRDSSGFSLQKFGHLPVRQYTALLPDLEQSSQSGDFDPRTLLTESNRVQALSPLTLHFRGSASGNSGYRSLEREAHINIRGDRFLRWKWWRIMAAFQVRFFQVVWLYVSFIPSPFLLQYLYFYMDVGQSHLHSMPANVHLFVEF
jgi:hypothetical protein